MYTLLFSLSDELSKRKQLVSSPVVVSAFIRVLHQKINWLRFIPDQKIILCYVWIAMLILLYGGDELSDRIHFTHYNFSVWFRK